MVDLAQMQRRAVAFYKQGFGTCKGICVGGYKSTHDTGKLRLLILEPDGYLNDVGIGSVSRCKIYAEEERLISKLD